MCRPMTLVASSSREEVEHLGEAHVDRVPQPHAEPQTQPVTAGKEARREVHSAAAGDDGRGPGFEPGHVGHEVGHDSVDRVHEPRGVRAQGTRTPYARGDRLHLRLQLPAARRLRETSGADDRGADTGPTTVLQRQGHCFGRHDEHGQIDGGTDRLHRARDWAALDLGCGPVHEMELTGKPEQRPNHRVARFPRRRARSDNRDRLRAQKRPKALTHLRVRMTSARVSRWCP